MPTTRTLSFRLYPSPAQDAAMARKHGMLKDLWNAALEELIKNGTYKTIMGKYGMTSAMIEEAYIVDSADKIRK